MTNTDPKLTNVSSSSDTASTDTASFPAIPENEKRVWSGQEKRDLAYIVVTLLVFLGVILPPDAFMHEVIKVGIVIQTIMGIVVSFRPYYIPRGIVLTVLTVGTLALIYVLN